MAAPDRLPEIHLAPLFFHARCHLGVVRRRMIYLSRAGQCGLVRARHTLLWHRCEPATTRFVQHPDPRGIMSKDNPFFSQTLNVIAAKTEPETERRIVAVRWFNRLYYDIAKWHQEFVEFLLTYPGFRKDSTASDFETFYRRLAGSAID
jgi:hypothetical protein